MSTGKAPGPDGFTLAYHKSFQAILGPKFVKAFKSNVKRDTLSQDTPHDVITVIPKEAKDPQ